MNSSYLKICLEIPDRFQKNDSNGVSGRILLKSDGTYLMAGPVTHENVPIEEVIRRNKAIEEMHKDLGYFNPDVEFASCIKYLIDHGFLVGKFSFREDGAFYVTNLKITQRGVELNGNVSPFNISKVILSNFVKTNLSIILALWLGLLTTLTFFGCNVQKSKPPIVNNLIVSTNNIVIKY